MLHIKCPHCGIRSQNEFSYGGDATIKRPELGKEISDQDWDNFVYNRKSLRGKHWELWQHLSGCRQWIKVQSVIEHELAYWPLWTFLAVATLSAILGCTQMCESMPALAARLALSAVICGVRGGMDWSGTPSHVH